MQQQLIMYAVEITSIFESSTFAMHIR